MGNKANTLQGKTMHVICIKYHTHIFTFQFFLLIRWTTLVGWEKSGGHMCTCTHTHKHTYISKHTHIHAHTQAHAHIQFLSPRWTTPLPLWLVTWRLYARTCALTAGSCWGGVGEWPSAWPMPLHTQLGVCALCVFILFNIARRWWCWERVGEWPLRSGRQLCLYIRTLIKYVYWTSCSNVFMLGGGGGGGGDGECGGGSGGGRTELKCRFWPGPSYPTPQNCES